MWSSRLKNKTSFSKACSKLVKDNDWVKLARQEKNTMRNTVYYKKFHQKKTRS